MLRLNLPRCRRLTRDRDFQRALRQGCRKPRGPLTFHVHPNEVGPARLGLSIGRRLGSAVERHRLKRLLREAFRLSQHELPAGFDVVITARRHKPLRLEEYRRLLGAGMQAGEATWRKRQTSRADEAAEEQQ